MLLDKIQQLLGRPKPRPLQKEQAPTKHPGSKKWKNKRKRRDAAKRAKASRKRNR